MRSLDGTVLRGIEGGEAPSRADGEDTSASEVSDTSTARPDPYPLNEVDAGVLAGDGATSDTAGRQHRRRAVRSKLDIDFGGSTLVALRARADCLGLRPGAWVRAVVRDALDQRRTDQVDAAVGAAMLALEREVQASADARTLAAQIRPLAANVNDLDARARSGLPVVLGSDTPELVRLLREVRELLADRVAS